MTHFKSPACSASLVRPVRVQARRLLLGLGLTFACAYPAVADDPPWRRETLVPVKMAYLYDLTVTTVPPPPYMENEPVTVGYKLVVKSYGVTGTLPEARDGMICGAKTTDDANCKRIGPLRNGRTATGTIVTTAVAGALSPFTIRLLSPQKCAPGRECFGTEPLAEASANRPVAARYYVNLDSFTILHTRARSTDTVMLASMMGRVEGQRSAAKDACDIQPGPPRYCLKAVKQGDHQDGTHPMTGARIGPFDLVPEVDPDLTFTYVLMNFGTPYELRVFNQIMLGINDLTAGGLQAYSGATGGGGGGGEYGSWTGLHDFTAKIQNMQSGGCDGPVAVDMVTALNKAISGQPTTLDYLTRTSGKWTNTSPEFVTESQGGCGNDSKYRVTYSVDRTSWKAPAP